MEEQSISFHSEDIDFSLSMPEKTINWIKEVIREEGGELSFINYVFCSDSYLLKINIEYLDHDTFTDIITFPYSESSLESDIFISIDRVKENANTFKVSFEHELHRVMIHGVLHLLGYGDKTPEEQTAMRAKENFWIEKHLN